MSILKSILHRYNTTNQNYDTLHPETEHAQVTDFGQGVIAHLASSTLVSLVTSVSTGSVFGKMVEKLLEASGVQYNFTNANAWYICLGSLFGGLIIQGGFVTQTVGGTLPVNYPLTGTSRTIALSLAPDATSSNQYSEIPQYISPSKQGFTWYGVAHDNAEHPVNGSWIAMVL